MTMGNVMAESLGKFIFHAAKMASSPFADLLDGSTSGSLGTANPLTIALHTSDPGIAGTQATNVATYTSYANQTKARTSTDWPFTSPNIFENGGTDITFPTNTGTAQTVSWASIGTGASSRLILRTPLALETPRPFVLDDASGDVIRVPAHGYADDQEVIFVDVEGATLPTGITEGTTYYVRASGKTADTFTISAAAGGSAVAITAQGSGYISKVSQKVIGTNDFLVFNTSNKLTFILR